MNRPTVDVDDLIQLAEEASADRDYLQAVKILRRAAEIAPLRKDIRNRLAVALEHTPSTKKPGRPSDNIVEHFSEAVPAVVYDDEVTAYFDETDSPESGREAISEVARKAFKAAADTSARAGVATRHLTNLLNQGIQTWKSSLLEQSASSVATKAPSATIDSSENSVSRTTQAGVFTPDTELQDYLERAEVTNSHGHIGFSNTAVQEEPVETPVASKLTRPSGASQKSSRTYTPKKNTARPTDVEDVLAAGIGGFIEAVGCTDKKKLAFGVVYVALAAIFAFACFDVSRKFPSVEAVPGQNIVTANLGALDLTEGQSSQDAIQKAHALVSSGRTPEAIDLLRHHLASGKMLKTRDKIRVELATLLNTQAEENLRDNKIAESVRTYKEALEILPSDGALQLRLSNALYYLGTIGNVDSSEKNHALAEARDLLAVLASQPGDNLQANRLLALVLESLGDKELAAASWAKVKKETPEGSAEHKEALAHLK